LKRTERRFTSAILVRFRSFRGPRCTGALIEEPGSHMTPRWRGQSRANSSLSQNSLLAGKIQGISSIRSLVARQRGPKRPSTQCLTSQFPTHPNREFFEALQGIKSGDQGNFFPHQGIRSRPLFGICFDDKCDRPDRPRLCREGEEGAARCSKPPKPISRSTPVLSV